MIAEETGLVVADNSGAKRVKCFRVLGQRKRYAHVGDIIKVSVKEAQPGAAIKKGQVCDALVVRTKAPIRIKYFGPAGFCGMVNTSDS